MKIYPSHHDVIFKEQLSSLTLPLGYVQNNNENQVVKIEIEPEFRKPYQETPLKPYQKLTSNDILLFDAMGKPIWDNTKYIRQKDGIWNVIPQQTREFYPKEFAYNVLLERNDTYNKSSKYDISLCFYWEQEGTDKIKRALASLFQNKGQAQRYPSNIVLNGGDVTLMMLANLMRLRDSCDLYICHADTPGLDIAALLNNHTNLWIYDDSFDGLIQTSNQALDAYYELDSAEIFSSGIGFIMPDNNGQYIYFNQDAEWADLQDETYQRVSLFKTGSPLRVYKKQDAGFLILSHPSFLENLNFPDNDAHLRLFFEVLLYVYLHSYYQTQKRTSWITDETIDYYINPNQPYYLSHPRISLPRILAEEGYNTNHAYQIININTEPKEDADLFQVTYLGTNRFEELLFKKEALTPLKDPAKGNNILVYTMNQSLLLCNPEDISAKLIESGITIRVIDEWHIGVSAVKSSNRKIYTEEEQILELKDLEHAKESFVVTFNDGEFSIDGSGLIIARGTISVNTNVLYRDIRRLGGGEASEEPNYEMIDSSCLYGRPYRYGCPMIIQLPERYLPMHNEIMSEVKKHITSGDYPIILYEE